MNVVKWVGLAKRELAAMPEIVRRKTGHQLARLQNGLTPKDFKSMKNLGAGVYELRVKVNTQYRFVYVSKFSEAIYVLHVFKKKTNKTARKNIELIKKRYSEMMEWRNE